MSLQEYEVHNLDCASCSNKIEEAIKALPEVNEANLDFLSRKLVVHYHAQVDVPLRRLNQIAETVQAGVQITARDAAAAPDQRTWRWLFLALGSVLALTTLFAPPQLKIGIGLAAYLLVAWRVLLGAGKSLWGRQVFSEQLLMSIATVGALVLGEYLEACAVMVFYELGLALENKALERSRGSVRGLLAAKPELAHVETPQGIHDRKLAEVAKDDVILVYPGERVPLDGLIIKGESTVDTSTLTGESEPLYVFAGTEIFAGFINASGLLEIRVTGTEAESTVTRILNLIESAGARKAPQEKFISRFSRVYTPVVVLLALLVFLVPTLLGQPASVWFKRSLVFLIVSCPCALVISIPLSYYIGIGLAARRGIILKGSVFLDSLRKVVCLVFDKTGTLTTGDLRIEQVYPAHGADPEELQRTLYLCEYTSTHPFARAVREAFPGNYESRLVTAYSEYAGQGVKIEYASDRLLAGSEAFLREYGYFDLQCPGGLSLVHAVKNDVYLGCVAFSDNVRPGLQEALAELREYGVRRLVLLSGDRAAKTEKISRELGLDSFEAELLPQHKLERLEAIMSESEGNVAFVGDGMNDAPSLARADVGIAMGGIGNQASVESADIVLLNDRPEQLTGAFRIARRTARAVTQNIALALGTKIMVMALGAAGLSGLWEAIIADVGVTLLVIINSLRILRLPRESLTKRAV